MSLTWAVGVGTLLEFVVQCQSKSLVLPWFFQLVLNRSSVRILILPVLAVSIREQAMCLESCLYPKWDESDFKFCVTTSYQCF